MYLNKLAKYFSGNLPNSNKKDISEFVKILGNLDLEGSYIKDYGTKYGSIKKDYINLFEAILDSKDGLNKIYSILDYFDLPESFIKKTEYKRKKIGKFNQKYEKNNKKFADIGVIEEFLDSSDEEEFARYLMIPLLKEMGFKQLSFYGKVYEKDYGIDMYPIVYETPFGDSQYLGIQFKQNNIGHCSTNKEWKNLKSELDDALSHNGEHISLNGSKIKLDGIIVITSGRKTMLNVDKDLHERYNDSYVRIYDKEDILKWCKEYVLPINVINKIKQF